MKKGLLVFGLLLSPIFAVVSCSKPNEDTTTRYTVTFYAEKGYFRGSSTSEMSKTLEIKVKEGDTVDRPLNPIVYDGDYEFDTWCKDTGTIDPFDFVTPINKNIDLYARYNFAGEEPFYFEIASEGEIGESISSVSFSTYDSYNNLLDFNNIRYYVGTSYEFANWQPYTENEEITFMEGQKLYIIADERSWQYAKISYENDDNLGYNIGGNIMSLLSSSAFKNKKDFKGQQNVFNGLFCNDNDKGQTNGQQLKDASNLKLPATLLTYGCYENMFAGSGITHAPRPLGESEPVMVSTRSCYQMFGGCEELGPTISGFLDNVSTADDYAFYRMFSECNNITTFDGFSVGSQDTQLGQYACSRMFERCIGFAKIENINQLLPSLYLGDYCYSHMFYYCAERAFDPTANGLKEITGYLPATTLVPYCYAHMFDSAYLLEKINNDNDVGKFLPSTNLAIGCYQFLFNYCAFTEIVGSLPATTLADYCYHSMFDACTYLTTVDYNLLSLATTLAPHCYQLMFSMCNRLIEAPYLPYEFDPSKKEEWKDWIDCYREMFSAGTSSWNSLTKISVGFSSFPYINDGTAATDYVYTTRWVLSVAIKNEEKTKTKVNFCWSGEAYGTDLTNVPLYNQYADEGGHSNTLKIYPNLSPVISWDVQHIE